MKSNNDSLIGCAVALLLIPQVIWSGFVLSVLWGWFISAAFNAPQLSIAPAIGLSMVVRYLTYQQLPADKSKSSTERVIEALAVAFIQPAVTLGFGYIVHLFV